MLKPLDVLKLYPEHDYTLNGALASRAQRDPRRPFILFAGKSWSWAEFIESVEKTAQLLVTRGVRKSDRIGAIMVPSNPEFGVQEAGYVLQHAGVSAVACNEVGAGVAGELWVKHPIVMQG